MQEEVVILLVSVTFIMGAVVLIVVSMINRRHLREMAHRERLAMIERGLVPPPEKDPARFEAATGLSPALRPHAPRGERYRTAGVAMLGIGAGLFLLIGGIGGVLGVAVGVGGAWMMLGAALLLNYFLMNREPRGTPPSPWTAPAAPRDSEPPPNVAP